MLAGLLGSEELRSLPVTIQWLAMRYPTVAKAEAP